jgi:putative transposase
MRQARIRGEGKSYYHCISRVVDRQFVLNEEEKEHFVALMRKLEAFHGMRVVTYCIMSNHFHILVEEPDRESVAGLDAETIFRRIGFLYDSFTVRIVQEEWEWARTAGDSAWAKEILDRYRNRMGDLAGFMKDLKQRYSQLHNRRQGRKGTLWEDRYKSVLVEGDSKALMTMAAYIDLNPLRAGMVSKVEDYRWCGYASAVGGNRWARRGLGRILTTSDHVSGEELLIARNFLFHPLGSLPAEGPGSEGVRSTGGATEGLRQKVRSGSPLNGTHFSPMPSHFPHETAKGQKNTLRQN